MGHPAGSGFNVILNFDANNKISNTNCVPTNTYCYDAMGNLLQDTFHTYAYDAEGRILTVDATGTPTTYAYDAMGRRVQRTKAGVVSYFGYDLAGHSIIEYQTSAAVRFEGYAGPRHLVSYINGLTYFDFQDVVGSERVHMTQNGASYENTYSLPFGDGQVTSGVGGSTGATHFTGKERDGESNLDYFGARYYSSTEGRFSSPDKLKVTSKRVSDPQGWDLYEYAHDAPTVLFDPDGNDWVWAGARNLGNANSLVFGMSMAYMTNGRFQKNFDSVATSKNTILAIGDKALKTTSSGSQVSSELGSTGPDKNSVKTDSKGNPIGVSQPVHASETIDVTKSLEEGALVSTVKHETEHGAQVNSDPLNYAQEAMQNGQYSPLEADAQAAENDTSQGQQMSLGDALQHVMTDLNLTFEDLGLKTEDAPDAGQQTEELK
jgi:RHS repeat-associated protein